MSWLDLRVLALSYHTKQVVNDPRLKALQKMIKVLSYYFFLESLRHLNEVLCAWKSYLLNGLEARQHSGQSKGDCT